jgi:allantoinase
MNPAGPVRDFVGYATDPPDIVWPSGGRMAVNVILHYEEGAERNRLDGDSELEISEAVYPAPPLGRELLAESVYEYGSRVGIWRLLEVLERYEVIPTMSTCALALERNPVLSTLIRDRNLDVIGHGYRWVPSIDDSDDALRSELSRAKIYIEQQTGTKIRGWSSRPPYAVNTRSILAELGVEFDCNSAADDLPYFVDVDGRRLLSLPYSSDTDDLRFWRPSLYTAQDFTTYCKDAFDTL